MCRYFLFVHASVEFWSSSLSERLRRSEMRVVEKNPLHLTSCGILEHLGWELF